MPTETRLDRLIAQGPLRSLGHGPFALLWCGQTVSRVGDSLYRIALAWWVLEQTGSAAAMGTVLAFSFTPMLLFLLIGGVAVDRLPRVQLMLASDVLRAMVVGGVAVFGFVGALELWHIYLASVTFGFVNAFFQPAYQSLVPEITPAETLPSANALTSISAEIIQIIGPGIGAALVALGGTATAFALNAASFLVSAAFVLPLLGQAQAPAPARERTHVLSDAWAGLQTVFGSAWLWITIAIFALINVTSGGPYSVALPFLVGESLGAGVDVLGLLYSSAAVGAVGTALWLGRATKLRRRGLLAYSASFVGGAAIFALGLPIGLAGMLVAAFAKGASLAVFSLIWTNTLQELVPRERLGRVVSVDMLGSFVLLPVGFGLAGWATDLLGAQQVFLIGGACSMALIALGLLHPAIRRLD